MRVLTYTHTYKHEGTHIRTHTLPLYLSLFFTSTARSLPIPLITYIQGIWEGHWMPFVCRRGGGGVGTTRVGERVGERVGIADKS